MTRSCSSCKLYQPERVTSPFTGCSEVVLMCVAGPEDVCPVSEALAREVEVIVPCRRCGGECDGYGTVDRLPVCPTCDKEVL